MDCLSMVQIVYFLFIGYCTFLCNAFPLKCKNVASGRFVTRLLYIRQFRVRKYREIYPIYIRNSRANACVSSVSNKNTKK